MMNGKTNKQVNKGEKMENNYFIELNKIDVNDKIEKKNGLGHSLRHGCRHVLSLAGSPDAGLL